MKLKDFHETFREDLKDPQFAAGYLQDCLEEGGIGLFISALKDVVRACEIQSEGLVELKEKENLFREFVSTQQPTFTEVFQVLNALNLNLEFRLSPMPTVA